MRIAILTQPLHNNYGGILQNFALQTVLKELGHEPVTLDMAYPKPEWSLYVRVLKAVWRFFKKLFGDKSIVFCDVEHQWNFMNNPGKEQQRFIQSNIRVLHLHHKLDRSFCVSQRFDAYIVGSDQIWRPRFSPFLPNYFLDFTQGENVRRLSYAASFGTNRWEGTAVDVVRLIPFLQKFDAVSVREESAVKLCWNVFGVDPVCVLDPTLLVNKSVYEHLLTVRSGITEPYLAIYVLDYSPLVKRLIRRICKDKNLKAVYLGQRSKSGYPSLESWLQGIFNSDYVLTDSFHGTVFSIIAHKQFSTVINSGRGASRFESLLGKLDLMDRLIADESFPITDHSIDYSAVVEKLEALKKESIRFLMQNLDEEHHS